MIRVDGVEIPEVEIAAEMQHQPAASREAAREAAVQALVVRRLLTDEAARQGLAGEAEAAVEALLQRTLHVPEADEATCRRWFEANRARFRTPETWHAAHLLLAADPEMPEERAAVEAEARRLAALVAADPERLPELARARSACSSREQGGDLGLIEPGTTVPEFEAALRALLPGEVHAEPVATRYGFHVLRLLHHAPGIEQPYEAVRERIALWLRDASWRRALHQYVTILAGAARIEGFALATADGPLVQ